MDKKEQAQNGSEGGAEVSQGNAGTLTEGDDSHDEGVLSISKLFLEVGAHEPIIKETDGPESMFDGSLTEKQDKMKRLPSVLRWRPEIAFKEIFLLGAVF